MPVRRDYLVVRSLCGKTNQSILGQKLQIVSRHKSTSAEKLRISRRTSASSPADIDPQHLWNIHMASENPTGCFREIHLGNRPQDNVSQPPYTWPIPGRHRLCWWNYKL